MDKERKAYYEYFTDSKWLDMTQYDLCIDSSRFSMEIIEHIVHWYKREIICKLQLTVNVKYPLTGFFLVYLCQGVEGDIVFFGSHVDQFFIIKTDVQVFSQSLADKASVASGPK